MNRIILETTPGVSGDEEMRGTKKNIFPGEFLAEEEQALIHRHKHDASLIAADRSIETITAEPQSHRYFVLRHSCIPSTESKKVERNTKAT